MPVALLAYHYGPGQDKLRTDELSQISDAINHYTDQQDWNRVIELADKAAEFLPENSQHLSRQLRLTKAHAQMFSKQLPEANATLMALVDEMEDDTAADTAQLDSARSALANSQYYMTWLMRLEGTDRTEWEPFIESSRQQYKLLAENGSPDTLPEITKEAALEHLKNLEATIRLARLDLGDLQGLPLPSQ